MQPKSTGRFFAVTVFSIVVIGLPGIAIAQGSFLWKGGAGADANGDRYHPNLWTIEYWEDDNGNDADPRGVNNSAFIGHSGGVWGSIVYQAAWGIEPYQFNINEPGTLGQLSAGWGSRRTIFTGHTLTMQVSSGKAVIVAGPWVVNGPEGIDLRMTGGLNLASDLEFRSAFFDQSISEWDTHVYGAGGLYLNHTGASFGVLKLLQNNSYQGVTEVSSGFILDVGSDDGTTGTIGLGDLDVQTGGQFQINRSNSYVIANNILGSGEIVQNGTGTSILSGNNTFAGQYSINSGTLQFGQGGSSSGYGGGDIVNNSILIFDHNDQLTVFDQISGTGDLVKNGSGTLVLSGNTSLDGVGIVNGTLRIDNDATVALAEITTGDVLAASIEVLSNADLITETTTIANQGTGTLTISSGGVVQSQYGRIGQLPGSVGTVNISDVGSSYSLAESTYLGGFGGAGQINVTNSGSFQTTNSVYVGGNNLSQNGTGHLNVFSSGNATIDGDLTVWESGNATVGTLGLLSVDEILVQGMINVSSGGEVASRDSYVGQNNGTNATASVDGANTKWSCSEVLYVGDQGIGTFYITNGGFAECQYGRFGQQPGSTGVVDISDSGSTLSLTQSAYLGGFGGSGILNISDNATFQSASSVFVGGNNLAQNGTGDLDISRNGKALITGDLTIWETGTASISTQGDLSADEIFVEGSFAVDSDGGVTSRDSYIGRNNGTNATASVDGVGSTWTCSDVLYVGNQGNGSLTVANGSVVESQYGRLGQLSGGVGTVEIFGSGSTWSVTNSNYLGGFGGHGELVVRNDGSYVGSDSIYVGGNNASASGSGLLVVESGATIKLQNNLRIWESGALTINGGNVVANQLSIAPSANHSVLDGSISVNSVYADQLDVVGGVLSMQQLDSYTSGVTTVLNQTGGVLAPGASPGLTAINGSYVVDGGSVQIELGGVDAIAEHDVVDVIGDLSIVTGQLQVLLIDNFEITEGMSFHVINVGGNLSGIFDGLGEGDLVGNFGGTNLFITYLGGDGNDVVLFAGDSAVLYGDVNLDGSVNLLDVDFFIDRLSNGTYQAEADCNEDREVNLLDIDPFIAILGGG